VQYDTIIIPGANMRIFRLLAVCGILFALATASAGSAMAQESAPIKTIDVRIGPYPMRVSYYTEAQGGKPLSFSIEPQEALAGPIEYQVTAVPGTTVNAVPIKARLTPDPNLPGAVRGIVNLPVSGQWMLTIDVTGPKGRGGADVPILAGAPPAMPEWLGWLIGLLPVWLIIGLVIWQARRALAHRDSAGATMPKSAA
jgi:hypothetical protein